MERRVVVAVVPAAADVVTSFSDPTVIGGNPIWLFTQFSPPGVLIFAATDGDHKCAARCVVVEDDAVPESNVGVGSSTFADVTKERVFGR